MCRPTFPSAHPPGENLPRPIGWYRDLNGFFKETLGLKVQKIPIDAGCNCPNRDGTIGVSGCIYCDARGSGTGAWKRGLGVTEQIEEYLSRPRRTKAQAFLAYFQSFTNTYGPLERLKSLWDEALGFPGIIGLCLGTRPDCLEDPILDVIEGYVKRGLVVWLELGLQSAHDATLAKIKRGHRFMDFVHGLQKAQRTGALICVHLIVGLPGETRDHIVQTAKSISELPIHGIKLHGLYVVKGTEMETLWSQGTYRCLELEEYVELVCDVLENIPPSWVVHRLTSDPDPQTLLCPEWMLEKHKILHLIKERLVQRATWQGKLFRGN